MRVYSPDLREGVMRAVDQGYKRTDIIKLFGVSRATIKRYLKQRRETGNVSRKPIPGRPAKKGAPLQGDLVAQLEAPRCCFADALPDMGTDAWYADQHQHDEPGNSQGWLDSQKEDVGCYRAQ